MKCELITVSQDIKQTFHKDVKVQLSYPGLIQSLTAVRPSVLDPCNLQGQFLPILVQLYVFVLGEVNH